MSSIFNCWNCNESLLGRRRSEATFFFCNAKCMKDHKAASEAREKKRGRVEAALDRAWKKEMEERDALCAAIREGRDLPKSKPGPKPKKKKKKKVVSGDKKTTTRKTPSRAYKREKRTTKTNRARIRRLGEKRRTVACSICAEQGHNARTCQVKNK